MRTCLVLCVVWVCVLSGCSGASSALFPAHDSGTPHGEPDASRGGDASTADAPAAEDAPSMSACNPTAPDDASCNSVGVAGPLVPLQCIQGTMPTPAGGTILDGSYALTASVYYGTSCPGAQEDRDTWLVCGSTWQTAQEHTIGTMPAQLHTYDAVVSSAGPAALSLEITCGTTLETLMFQYDATPTTLTLYLGGTTPGEGEVDTYTLQ